MLIKLSTKCNRAVITLQKKKLFLLIKIGFRKVTQIDPQTLLKINPQTLLKISFTSVNRNRPTSVTQTDPQTLLKLTHKR